MGQLWNRHRATALAAAMVLMSGCEATLKPGSVSNIQDFISGVTNASGTVNATLVTGDPPSPAGGPAASVAGIAVMINGAASLQTVSGAATFNRVIVAASGMTNYYQLDLPGSVASEGVLLRANPNAYAGRLDFLYAVSAGGVQGNYAAQQMRLLRVGTGDIQISVAWGDSSDVDLHVVDPNGEEIYFANKTSASGGVLDLDANAACTADTFDDGSPPAFVSNENVVWPAGQAIPGTYTVILDYWSPCGVAKTDYVVTIQRTGAQPKIFTGSFVGVSAPDDTVSVFTY